MIRFVCPRCQAVLEQPDNVAGTTFTCPSCGQRLQIPASQEKALTADLADKNLSTRMAPPAPEPAMPPPPPLVTANPDSAAALPTPPPLPAPARSRRRDPADDDEDYDSPSIARRSPRRGRYSQEAAAKAASAGLVCSLISLAMLLVSFLLRVVTVQRPGGRFAGESAFVVIILFVILGSFVLALLGIVFSSRGLDESNSYNRGQATAGFVCGIISLVIGLVLGLFFFCAGIFIWSIH